MEKSVLRETVYAFNDNDTVATYDSDMDVWHPNRAKMASIVCEILPFNREGNLKFLDLGVGTGYLSRRIMKLFQKEIIIAKDAVKLIKKKPKKRFKNLCMGKLLNNPARQVSRS